MTGSPRAFVPPEYPYDRLRPIAATARAHPGGMVDLSIGTPCDEPPAAVVAALASSEAERGYPPGVGSDRLLDAARALLERRFGVAVARSSVAACIGTKELVAGLPHWLRLRQPERDTVLYPAVSYPTYAMGARLAGCRAVPVASRADGALDLDSVDADDVGRSLCLWVNSPANPTGALDDLAAAARFGRAHGVPVISDECYAEFTWASRPRTILEHGLAGVLAVHSISKRSNCAGLRVGFYAGDPELVGFLAELRRHAGFMVPGPVQLAGAVALDDDVHVERQRARYMKRLAQCAEILTSVGAPVELPAGGFYLWVPSPAEVLLPATGDDATDSSDRADSADPAGAEDWRFARLLAVHGGVLVSPGELYGPSGAGHVRVALVQPSERIALVGRRLDAARSSATPLPAR